MLFKSSSHAVTLAVVLFLGCASTETRSSIPELRPLERETEADATEQTETASTPSVPTGDLNLKDALQASLAMNPRLAAFSWEVRALDAEVLQSSLLPNPELGAEFENFGGTGQFAGFIDSEITLTLSQLIELGGKRRKREAVAALSRDIGGWEYKSARLDVFTATAQAFVMVVAAERRAGLAQQANQLAIETLNTVSERVDAGKVSPLERERTRVLASSSRIALDRAQRELEMARQNLATQWGAEIPEFGRAIGNLEQIGPVPPLSELIVHLDRNPDLARWTTEQELRQAELELAQAGAVPDVTAAVGLRRFTGPDETAFTAGVQFALPVFNRNQGAVLASSRRLSKVREEQRLVRSEARGDLKNAYEMISGAWFAANSLRDEVLPAAERTFEAVQDAYQQGKAGYLEVLDAQGALVAARFEYVYALESYHRARAAVERLIAGTLAGGGDSDGGVR